MCIPGLCRFPDRAMDFVSVGMADWKHGNATTGFLYYHGPFPDLACGLQSGIRVFQPAKTTQLARARG